MNSSAEQELAAHLDRGESLLWSGRPKQGVVLRPIDAFMIPFSLLWGGFAFFWEARVLSSGASVFFALWGLPFVLMGVYITIGRFFVDARLRGATVYGLTPARVLIVSGLFARRVTSLNLRTLRDVSLSERGDRSGTITFGASHPLVMWAGAMSWPGAGQFHAPSFELIAEARSVYSRVRDAQKSAA
jgi:Bacterial PH domain